MKDRTVTVNGFSKSLAMAGWRLGNYSAPDDLFEQTNKIQSHTVTCATSFAQHGAVEALEGPQQPVAEMRKAFRDRRDAAVNKLCEEGISLPRPDGAFYLFIPVETNDDIDLCEEFLIDQNVAVTPGSAFGVEGYIRLSYANKKQRILEGIDRISDSLGDT
jgi:aspartate aminotransferase